MARLKGSPRNGTPDLGDEATENAHFITPTKTVPKYRIVVCGAQDDLTGRRKLLERYGCDPEGKAPHAQIFDLRDRVYVVELAHVSPSWCYGPLLDYHCKYSHAFAFVITPSSRKTLEVAAEMREMVHRYLKSHGMELSESERRPMILIVNLDATLGHPETLTEPREPIAGGDTTSQPDRPIASTEIMALADEWSCDYAEIDTSQERDNGVADVIFSFSERLVDLKVQAAAHKPVSGELTPEAPRSFLFRRVLGHLAPTGLFGSKR